MRAKPILIAATCAVLSIGLSDPARAGTAPPSTRVERIVADWATTQAATVDLSAQKRKPAKASKKAKAGKKAASRKKAAKSKGGKGHLGHH